MARMVWSVAGALVALGVTALPAGAATLDSVKERGRLLCGVNTGLGGFAMPGESGKWAGFDVEFLKGDNNWPAVMKALDDINYHGWGIAEQGGAGNAEGLQKLSGEMDRIFAS